jgi:hypothetical protein
MTGGSSATTGDRWCPPTPVRVRCDTDPARTERSRASTSVEGTFEAWVDPCSGAERPAQGRSFTDRG